MLSTPEVRRIFSRIGNSLVTRNITRISVSAGNILRGRLPCQNLCCHNNQKKNHTTLAWLTGIKKSKHIIVHYRIRQATTGQFVFRVWSVAMLMLCSGDVIWVTVEVASLFSELASQEFILSSGWEFWSSNTVKHPVKDENCTEAWNWRTWCTENFPFKSS